MSRGERGSASIEAAVGVPAFVLFIGLIIFAGRMSIAHNAVQASAADAARIASIARTQPAANAQAGAAAAASLANQNVHCVTYHVAVDTTGFAAPAGTEATVTASVTCVVNLSDLSIPGIPGTRTVTATMSSPLDTFRER